MEKSKITGAIFDMDGTLVNSMIYWDLLWDMVMERYPGRDRAYFKELEKKMHTMTLVGAIAFLAESLGVADEIDELSALANDGLEDFYKNHVMLKNGARELLLGLAEKGVKICLASATEHRLIKVSLARCGIDSFFSATFSCDDIKKGKDCPDIYELALEHLGTDKSTTFVFEDALTAINTASSIGLGTVAIYEEAAPDKKAIREAATYYVDKGEPLTKALDYFEFT